MRYRFYTLDVFTDRVFGGNPLAVLPDARGLTTNQMQQVAREFNLSETVFVLPPVTPTGARRLRIFTPQTELPFAGHPTVGTAHLLAALGMIPQTEGNTHVVLEEEVGPVPVTIRSHNGVPVFVQLSAAKLPEFGDEAPAATDLAAILSLDPAELECATMTARPVSCGVPFLIVPVRDRIALGRARLDRERWQTLMSDAWAPHLYLVSTEPERPDSDLRARMFAPAMGIEEDPATGAAAAALAGYLAAGDDIADGTLRWTVEQGWEMGRPSLLYLEADKQAGQVTAVRVGGSAVQVSEGTIEIPGENSDPPSDERRWEAVELGADCPAPAGAYSRGIRAGNLLFVSGQVPKDPRTGELQGADVRSQTKAVLANLRAVLEAGGARMDDVVSVTAYLADIDDWGEFNAVYREAFRQPYPTRTTVGSELKDVLVEISAIAHLR